MRSPDAQHWTDFDSNSHIAEAERGPFSVRVRITLVIDGTETTTETPLVPVSATTETESDSLTDTTRAEESYEYMDDSLVITIKRMPKIYAMPRYVPGEDETE